MQDISKLTREQLEALVASMAKQAERKITLKITAPKLDEKSNTMKGTSGAISLYGLGRFPITLYRSQWERLAAAMPDVAKFIDANSALLSTKG